jgi:hypothetical protein
VRGEIFATTAMAWILVGRYDELRAPLAWLFIQSIRNRFPALADASTKEIANFMLTEARIAPPLLTATV